MGGVQGGLLAMVVRVSDIIGIQITNFLSGLSSFWTFSVIALLLRRYYGVEESD